MMVSTSHNSGALLEYLLSSQALRMTKSSTRLVSSVPCFLK